MNDRLIVLDTETTGLEPSDGHRIIEIGCVEMRNRRLTQNNFHEYIQPDRLIDAGAMEVHGITNEFLVEKPRFAAIAEEFYNYIKGAELIIHNAPFDVGFIEHEFRLLGQEVELAKICTVTDSLAMARKMFPGQRNNLDALCKRLAVNNTHRTLHGALLDSEILADVYLLLTGGQESLSLDVEEGGVDGERRVPIADLGLNLPVIRASESELESHEASLQRLFNRCPFIKLFLAFGQSNFNFHSPAIPIQSGTDDGKTFAFYRANESR